MDLGADLCCSSAHKTLPVLTGGAYLHTSSAMSPLAKNALALFGSTSPSYLILQSLDAVNRLLADEYAKRLNDFIGAAADCKLRLSSHGFAFLGDEPTKLTIDAKAYGHSGIELAALLRQNGIECEFSDPDYLVCMTTPETSRDGLLQLEQTLISIPRRSAIYAPAPAFHTPKQVLSIREAILSPCKTLPVSESVGHILASTTVGCPPAVPILVCGEQIDSEAIEHFHYYGIETCCVVTE
jgi:arginine/lysine/ornithine decarboxylase